jgi:Aminotransferase class I and II
MPSKAEARSPARRRQCRLRHPQTPASARRERDRSAVLNRRDREQHVACPRVAAPTTGDVAHPLDRQHGGRPVAPTARSVRTEWSIPSTARGTSSMMSTTTGDRRTTDSEPTRRAPNGISCACNDGLRFGWCWRECPAARRDPRVQHRPCCCGGQRRSGGLAAGELRHRHPAAPEALDATRAAIGRGRSEQLAPLHGSPRPQRGHGDSIKRRGGPRDDGRREVVITCGQGGAMLDAVFCPTDLGDEVILTDPTHAGMINRVRLVGASPRLVRLQPQAGEWRLDTDALPTLVTCPCRGGTPNDVAPPTGVSGTCHPVARW